MSMFPPQRQLRSGSRCTTPHPWLVRCWHTGLGAQKEASGMIASATPRRWLLNHQHTPNSKQFKTAAYSKCCSKLKLWFIDHHFTLPSDPRRCTIRSGDENSWIWVNVQIEHSDLSGPPWLSLCRGHAYPHPIFPSRQKKTTTAKKQTLKDIQRTDFDATWIVSIRENPSLTSLYPHIFPSFAVSPISGEYPTLFAQHWLFPPRYLTENFALRHLIEAYETQLAEKRRADPQVLRRPASINELWWHYQPVICRIWGFP